MSDIPIDLLYFTVGCRNPGGSGPRHIKGPVRAELEPKVKLMRKLGLRLTIEKLQTADLSICLEHELGDYSHEILSSEERFRADSDKLIRATVESVLERLTIEHFNAWLASVDGGDPMEPLTDADRNA